MRRWMFAVDDDENGDGEGSTVVKSIQQLILRTDKEHFADIGPILYSALCKLRQEQVGIQSNESLNPCRRR